MSGIRRDRHGVIDAGRPDPGDGRRICSQCGAGMAPVADHRVATCRVWRCPRCGHELYHRMRGAVIRGGCR